MSYADWLKQKEGNWIFPDEPDLDLEKDSFNFQLKEDDDEEED